MTPKTATSETDESVSEAPRRADAVRNRERVIKAAEEVFGEHGIEAGIPEIAEKAGVGKGTVYRNFETKEDLVSAVLATRLARFNDMTVESIDKDDSWEAFRDLLRDAIRGKMQDRNFLIGLNHHGKSELLEYERERSKVLLGQLMDKAIEQGKMRKDAQAEDVSVLFGGICRVLNEQGQEDPKVWLRYADQVIDAFRVQPA
ncbi:MAG: TetR/AcrR family transcriptional regulator [Thermoleophilia bacterium]|nr:TetR/AcrR family transcriptional regulator [Thermoleophilia bacterium]